MAATLEAETKAKENSATQGDENAYVDERKRTPEENEQLLLAAQERVRLAELEAPQASEFTIQLTIRALKRSTIRFF